MSDGYQPVANPASATVSRLDDPRDVLMPETATDKEHRIVTMPNTVTNRQLKPTGHFGFNIARTVPLQIQAFPCVGISARNAKAHPVSGIRIS